MSYDPNYRPQDGPYNQTSAKGIPPYLQAPDMAGEYLSAMGGPMRGLFGGGGGPQAPGQGGVSGGDFLDAFTKAIAGHLAAQDSLAPAKLQQGNDLLLGRHLGTGGRPEGESQGNAWAQQSWQSPAERASKMSTNYAAVAPAHADYSGAPSKAEGAAIAQRFGEDPAYAERGLEANPQGRGGPAVADLPPSRSRKKAFTPPTSAFVSR